MSRALGDTTTIYETGSASTSSKAGDWLGVHRSTSAGTSTHLSRRALLTPDEVRRLPSGCAILFVAGQAPVLVRKVVYHADPEFRGLFDGPDRAAPMPADRGPIRQAAE